MLCVDEKSQVQALDRTQPLLPMRPGQAERQTYDYKRNGTTTLLAALEVANRRVIDAEFSRERGAILVQDSQVAESVPVEDQFEFQRQYPLPLKYAHLTGFYSYVYGATGVESNQNDILSGSDQRLRPGHGGRRLLALGGARARRLPRKGRAPHRCANRQEPSWQGVAAART